MSKETARRHHDRREAETMENPEKRMLHEKFISVTRDERLPEDKDPACFTSHYLFAQVAESYGFGTIIGKIEDYLEADKVARFRYEGSEAALYDPSEPPYEGIVEELQDKIAEEYSEEEEPDASTEEEAQEADDASTEEEEADDAAGWSEEKANKGEFQDSSGGSGVKYDAGKPSPARLPSRAVFEVSRVFRHGANKYDETDKLHDNNWRQGMNWSRLMDAALRHIYAFKQGEDLDRDSGKSHIAHAICSLMMLEEFRHIFPEGDDRDHKWRRGRGYVLDIDGVLANFTKAFQQKANRMGLVDEVQTPTHWGFPFDDEKVWEAIRDRGLNEFYAEEIEPYFHGSELPVDPVAYLTHRPCDTETTRKWLFENGFPQAPVVTVEKEKVEAANRIAEVQDRPLTFVDDRFKNFRELNRAGHHCLLYDRKMNRHHDVGPNYRISDLTELKDDSTYEQT